MKRSNDAIGSSARSSARIVVIQSTGIHSNSVDPLVDDFLASMPERYRQEFGRISARQHARTVAERGKQGIIAGTFSGSNAAGPGVCVVAPDAPGLLALISTAILLEGFDITRADAYTRRTPKDTFEAVDLFWVRRRSMGSPAALNAEELASLKSRLNDLVSNGNARNRLLGTLSGISSGASETRVQFKHVRGSPYVTLELESNDRPGLLALVASALATNGVRILDSRIRTHGLRVHDYFDIVDADGTRPTGIRLQLIQLATISAVDGSGHGP